MKKWLLLMAALAAIFILLWQFLLTPPAINTYNPPLKERPAPKVMAARPIITDEDNNPRFVKSLQQSSLRGTDVDRAVLNTDEHGELILVPGILVYFDYFLSLRGEMSPQRIEQLVWDDLKASYSEKIAAYLFDLFKRYLGYSDAVSNYLKQLDRQTVIFNRITEKDIEAQFQPQFFSPDEIENIFTAYNSMLNFQASGKVIDNKMKQYREAPPELRFAVATELFGAEAAGRLQALEQERERWQERLAEYRLQKQQIQQAGFDKASEAIAIQELLDRSFTAQEQIRVRTFERAQ